MTSQKHRFNSLALWRNVCISDGYRLLTVTHIFECPSYDDLFTQFFLLKDISKITHMDCLKASFVKKNHSVLQEFLMFHFTYSN
jgi:hypothetical protein